MSRSDWGGYIEPSYVPGPDDAHFLMGAQVGWSRAREQPADLPVASDLATRELVLVCPLCRSSDALGRSGVDVDADIRAGTSMVCAKCLRWGRDHQLARKMLAEYLSRGTVEPVLALADLPISPEARAAIVAEWAAREPHIVRR